MRELYITTIVGRIPATADLARSLVVAFLTSVGTVFFTPSAGSVLPTLVKS